MTFNRAAALPAGHRLYTSSSTLKAWHEACAANDNYESRGRPCTWPTVPGDWTTSQSLPRKVLPSEPQTDRQCWIGSIAANDNRPGVRWTGESNYGPDDDYITRKANPDASRQYEGDILSRLVAEGDVESAFVLRSIGQLLSPSGTGAANDNLADDADVEAGDGFGLDYTMEQDEAEAVVDLYSDTGRLPDGTFKFRQRSGAGGCKLAAKHRREEREGLYTDRYLALRGVAALPTQQYFSDGSTWWRSLAPMNGANIRELAAACDRTDWGRVTWIKYRAMGARVYGALSIFSEAKGIGEGKATAPEHHVAQEVRRSEMEKEFRAGMSERSMMLIDAALSRNSYTGIAAIDGTSRNGAKKAMKRALREAWEVASRITGEKMPEQKEKLAA